MQHDGERKWIVSLHCMHVNGWTILAVRLEVVKSQPMITDGLLESQFFYVMLYLFLFF
jgi:hypothetical protein